MLDITRVRRDRKKQFGKGSQCQSSINQSSINQSSIKENAPMPMLAEETSLSPHDLQLLSAADS
jgi:hypothetical protein